MIHLRVLNKFGIIEFKKYLSKLKQNNINEDPTIEKLSSNEYSKPYKKKIEIGQVNFGDRFSMGKYLIEKFKNVDKEDLNSLHGMWTWLTVYWFDVICPINDNGLRKIREISRYICSKDYTDYYRHYIASNYRIFDSLGEKYSKIFLYSQPYKHNDFIEQIASKQDLISNPCFIESVFELYWDESSGRPKVNSSNRKKKGNLRRLITFFDQIDLTYDTYKMNYDDIKEIFPKEFDSWKN